MLSTKKSSKESRRRFVKASMATGAGAVLGLGFLSEKRLHAYEQSLSYDVIVVGSGAAGMTAALKAARGGLKVLIVEKMDTFGGSTARSGGGIWIRNNRINRKAGIEDSFEEAREYLSQVVGSDVPQEKQDAYLRYGPEVIDFLLENTPLKFRWMEGYSDYYPELQGGKAQGASIEPKVLDGRLLGEDLKKLNPPYIPTPAGIVPYGGEYKWLTLATVTVRGAATAGKAISRYAKSLLNKEVPLSMGQALAAGLRIGLKKAGVPIWLESQLVDISSNDSGDVSGVVINRKGRTVYLKANYGVILASGGFEQNATMRRRFQAEPIGKDWTVGAKGNFGDGIVAGQRLGAALDLMDDAWWGPTIPLEPGKPYFCLSERSLPGSLIINGKGVRFVNEASPYHDVVNAMYANNVEGDQIPTWLITDQRYRNRYLFKDVLPTLPLPRSWYRNKAVFRARSLSGLARKIGVPADRLCDTVKTFNSYARDGLDKDFGRGESAYDRYYSDPGVGPNPSLGELNHAPYYAFKIVPGDLGTKGGLVTNEKSQVVTDSGEVIGKLYAAGNVSNGVMGRSYAGAGSTLGPAMTFGYIAANSILGLE